MTLPLDIWLCVLEYTDLGSTLTLGHVNQQFYAHLQSRDFEPRLKSLVQTSCPFIQPGDDGIEAGTWYECAHVIRARARHVTEYTPLSAFVSDMHNGSDDEDEDDVIQRELVEEAEEADFLYESRDLDYSLEASHVSILQKSGFQGNTDISIYNNYSEVVYQWQDKFYLVPWTEYQSLDLEAGFMLDLDKSDAEIWFTVLQLSHVTLIMKAYTDFTSPIGLERKHHYTLYLVDVVEQSLTELFSSFQVSSDLIGVFNVAEYNGYLWLGLGTKVTYPVFVYNGGVWVDESQVIRSQAYQYSSVDTVTKASLGNIPLTVPHRTSLLTNRHRRYVLVSFNPEYRCRLVVDLATGVRVECEEEDEGLGVSPALVGGRLEFVTT